MTKILVVDNYDSFVFNLVQYLQQLGAEVVVKRNDEVNAESINGFDGVLLSPGPGTPEDAGACIEIVNAAIEKQKPLLGVCLGHQAIGAALGGKVSRAPELLHGKTSQVQHKNEGVFKDLKSPFRATRYHSLAIETPSVPEELLVTATTDTGVIMGVKHKSAPIEGVQFHPESVLTEGGHRLLANWLETCGDKDAISVSLSLPSVN
ncbi:aminodeoxychorismate/anthranilate synthase component II [Actinomycetes bacterium]|jgi:para-aminobenzoate synthetase component 2|nr:aminodeoxychorismate/anthranilate synthase component II [Actinomycetes bacterium]